VAFRFSGTTIVGPRGDTGNLIFSSEAEGTSFTSADRLVFVLSSVTGGEIMRRTLPIDESGQAQLELTHEQTEALAPGRYLWSARYVLDAQLNEVGVVTGGSWVDTPWRNCEFVVQEVNGQL